MAGIEETPQEVPKTLRTAAGKHLLARLKSRRKPDSDVNKINHESRSAYHTSGKSIKEKENCLKTFSNVPPKSASKNLSSPVRAAGGKMTKLSSTSSRSKITKLSAIKPSIIPVQPKSIPVLVRRKSVQKESPNEMRQIPKSDKQSAFTSYAENPSTKPESVQPQSVIKSTAVSSPGANIPNASQFLGAHENESVPNTSTSINSSDTQPNVISTDVQHRIVKSWNQNSPPTVYRNVSNIFENLKDRRFEGNVTQQCSNRLGYVDLQHQPQTSTSTVIPVPITQAPLSILCRTSQKSTSSPATDKSGKDKSKGCPLTGLVMSVNGQYRKDRTISPALEAHITTYILQLAEDNQVHVLKLSDFIFQFSNTKS